MNRAPLIAPLIFALLLMVSVSSLPAEPTNQPAGAASAEWPQWRGPNRDGVAVDSPKLLDSWPKEGPPLLWKSEWIPAYMDGGCGGPVVANGRVFVYINKQPAGGGNAYKLITAEVLANAGWLPDIPDDLAKKIEDAWASKDRPTSDWPWWDLDNSGTGKVHQGLHRHIAPPGCQEIRRAHQEAPMRVQRTREMGPGGRLHLG
jgi:hypothetical protein